MRVQVRWARLLAVGLSVAVVLLLRENAALHDERREAVASPPRPITEVEVDSHVLPVEAPVLGSLNGHGVEQVETSLIPVKDLLRPPAVGFDAPLTAGPDLTAEELVIALKAMTGAPAPQTSIELCDDVLLVTGARVGRARIDAAVERLRDPGPDDDGWTTCVDHDTRGTGFYTGLHSSGSLVAVLGAMTGLPTGDAEEGRPGMVELTAGGLRVTQTAEGHERVRRALAALRRAAGAHP